MYCEGISAASLLDSILIDCLMQTNLGLTVMPTFAADRFFSGGLVAGAK